MLGIYVRISSVTVLNRVEDRISTIDNQIAYGVEFAESKNLQYKIYQDVGISGTKFEERQGLQDLITDIQDKIITSVWYHDQTRLERSPRIRTFLSDLFDDYQITEYDNGVVVDDANPEQVLFRQMKSVVNHYYTLHSKTKIIRSKDRNARQGKSNGNLGYGYTTDKDKNIIIEKNEAKVIRQMFQMSLEGKGARFISQWLTENEIPTKKLKKEWQSNTVLQIIKSPLVKGDLLYKGEVYKVPAIVDEATWTMINENLQTHKSFCGKADTYKYLLKGLIKCNCGENYYGRKYKNPAQGNTYLCASKLKTKHSSKCRGVNIDMIEALVIQQVLFMVRREMASNSIEDFVNKKDSELNKIKSLNKELNEVTEQKKNLVMSVAKGLLTDEDITSLLSTLSSKEHDINEIIKQSRNLITQLDSEIERKNQSEFHLFDNHQTLSFDEKRKILIDYDAKIVIHNLENFLHGVEITTKSLTRGERKEFFIIRKKTNGTFVYGKDIEHLEVYDNSLINSIFLATPL